MDQNLSRKITLSGYIMTCFIVLSHCYTYFQDYSVSELDRYLDGVFTNFFVSMAGLAMTHFFCVTGFLLFRSITFKNYFQKIKSRVLTLLVPFVAWQVITAIVYAVFGVETHTIPDFLYRTFSFIDWPINGVLWYLYAVFFYALCSPALMLCFTNKFLGWCTVLLAILFLNVRTLLPIPWINSIFGYGYFPNMELYFPAYLIGCFAGKFSDDFRSKDFFAYLLGFLVAAIALSGVAPGMLNGLILPVLPILLLALVPAPPASWNLSFCKPSFLVYALQIMVIMFFKFKIDDFYVRSLTGFIPVSVYNVGIRLFILALDIAMATALYTILKKYAPKILGILTGSRS